VARLSMYVAYLVLVVLLVHQPSDAPWSAVAYAGGSCAMAVVALLFMRGWEPHTMLILTPSRAWTIVRESLPLGISSLLAQTIVNAPVLIVGGILSTTEAGFFGSAMKLVFFALMLDRVFYLLFLPAASRWASKPEQFHMIVAMGLKVVLLIAIPVTLFAMAYARTLTVMVYGDGYTAAAPIVAAAMPYFALTVVNTVMMTVLYATHQEKAFMATLAYGTTILVVLCVGLTWTVGTIGGGVALSLGELAMVVGLTWRVRKLTGMHLERILYAYLVAAGVTMIVFWLAAGLPTGVQAIAGLAAFFITLIAVKGVTPGDIHFLRQRLT